MIGRAALNERVREWGLREDVVEKDYVLGWLLWGIGADAQLRATWVFKGGTCLKKCYIETYRFSEDLDFSLLVDEELTEAALMPVIEGLLQRVGEESGINFAGQTPRIRIRPSGRAAEVRVYYQGPRQSPVPASIKFDLTTEETVVRPTVLRQIAHPYDEPLPEPGVVRCYGFEEVFAEKLRALGERCRPRDLFDVINLYRRRDLRAEPALIRSVLMEKCAWKGLPVFTHADLLASPHRVELEGEWANMLEHQLPALPPFAAFWEELGELFAWLEGTAELTALPRLGDGATGEEADATWRPPPTVWTWREGVPLETIRFAGANHLCLELDYQGTTRVIEPYAMRRSQAGHLFLVAIRSDNRETRSYRVDRMRGLRVTTRAFTPTYTVEFAQVGPVSALPASPRSAEAANWTPFRPGRGSAGRIRQLEYILACPICAKRFRRQTRDLTLRPHKSPGGWACAGRRGVLVETRSR